VEYGGQAAEDIRRIWQNLEAKLESLDIAAIILEEIAEVVPAFQVKLLRVPAQGKIGRDGWVILPPDVEAPIGDRLLVVRGSGYALGLLAYGPIVGAALQHHKLAAFKVLLSRKDKKVEHFSFL
jgi:hypothetical protein